jgi:hypothetical protein
MTEESSAESAPRWKTGPPQRPSVSVSRPARSSSVATLLARGCSTSAPMHQTYVQK